MFLWLKKLGRRAWNGPDWRLCKPPPHIHKWRITHQHGGGHIVALRCKGCPVVSVGSVDIYTPPVFEELLTQSLTSSRH